MMSKVNAKLPTPVLIDETNLSNAWAKTVLHIMEHKGKEISPLILSVTGFHNNEVPENMVLRQGLDDLLKEKGFRNIENIAATIFPQRIWQLTKSDRKQFFKLYLETFCRYKKMNPSGNNRGLYFQRLINFGRGKCDGNQLEWILSQHESRKAVRRSMYQASVFDPGRDHVPQAQLQFPCMQHISFVPTSEGLVINAFYATQQLFVKAYGNYLGIAQLGAFMAHEMDMSLVRMNVTVGVAKLDKIPKTNGALRSLVSIVKAAEISD